MAEKEERWELRGRIMVSPGEQVDMTEAWMPHVEPPTRNHVCEAPKSSEALIWASRIAPVNTRREKNASYFSGTVRHVTEHVTKSSTCGGKKVIEVSEFGQVVSEWRLADKVRERRRGSEASAVAGEVEAGDVFGGGSCEDAR